MEPDIRQQHLCTLEEMHQLLDDIVLNDEVPDDVYQLFETAKNLSLYSWFMYRFHQVAELMSYTALEMALRHRYLLEHPNKKEKEVLCTARFVKPCKTEKMAVKREVP